MFITMVFIFPFWFLFELTMFITRVSFLPFDFYLSSPCSWRRWETWGRWSPKSPEEEKLQNKTIFYLLRWQNPLLVWNYYMNSWTPFPQSQAGNWNREQPCWNNMHSNVNRVKWSEILKKIFLETWQWGHMARSDWRNSKVFCAWKGNMRMLWKEGKVQKKSGLFPNIPRYNHLSMR